MHLQGSAMYVRRKSIGPTNALTKSQLQRKREVLARTLTVRVNTVDTKDTWKSTVGTFQRIWKRDLVDTSWRGNMLTIHIVCCSRGNYYQEQGFWWTCVQGAWRVCGVLSDLYGDAFAYDARLDVDADNGEWTGPNLAMGKYKLVVKQLGRSIKAIKKKVAKKK